MTQPQFNQKQRSYIRLSNGAHPDDQRAFNELQDRMFELRDQHQALADKVNSAKTQDHAEPKFNDNVGGIKVKAPTDPSTLKNGYTLRYSTASGQFEFGV